MQCRCGQSMFQIQYKIYSNSGTDMQRLLETNTNQTTDALPDSVDASIYFTGAPYIMYEQFKLDDNFRAYLEGTLISEHVLRTGMKSHRTKKSFKIVASTESGVVNFQGAKKHFFSLGLASDQHRSITTAKY